jgi:hypothetical protein
MRSSETSRCLWEGISATFADLESRYETRFHVANLVFPVHTYSGDILARNPTVG